MIRKAENEAQAGSTSPHSRERQRACSESAGTALPSSGYGVLQAHQGQKFFDNKPHTVKNGLRPCEIHLMGKRRHRVARKNTRVLQNSARKETLISSQQMPKWVLKFLMSLQGHHPDLQQGC